MRLDKYLSSLGLGSRKDVKKMIKAGRIRVDGRDKISPETSVDPKRDRIYADGALTEYREFVYIMLNKPKGYVSASEDKKHPAVTELVPEEFGHMGLFPAGRLDIDTEGLCLITNDGALAHRILSPKSHVPKTYIAELDGSVTESDIAAFERGVTLDDGYICKPAELEKIGNAGARIVIYEGKFHQIKRMFAARGIKVLGLKRVKMGGLCLDESLSPGEARELTGSELAQLENNKIGDGN